MMKNDDEEEYDSDVTTCCFIKV